VRVLMSTFGSEGDLKPPVAIGKMLQQFGAEVDFIANPFFEQKVLSEGLNFIGAGPNGTDITLSSYQSSP